LTEQAGRTPREDRLSGRRLYLCTPDRADLATFVEACIVGGVDVVQLRDKTLDDATVVRRAGMVAGVCALFGVPFILNDRPDLAVDAGADGVHVGQDDTSPAEARRTVGPDAIVGLSTHAPDELERSRAEPVDYVSAGPVVSTPTKPGRPGTGTGYVNAAVQRARHPVFVTGGVSPESVPMLARVGATRFVVVRYLTESDDPRQAAARLRAVIDREVEPA
jgi:thiamine-phosphate pyrophosphorylase